MNRILFEREEVEGGVATFGGVRARHVMDILHGEVGRVLKTGEVNGRVGSGEIVEIGGTSDEPIVRVAVRHEEESLQPWVGAILAPPRPPRDETPSSAACGDGRWKNRARRREKGGEGLLGRDASQGGELPSAFRRGTDAGRNVGAADAGDAAELPSVRRG